MVMLTWIVADSQTTAHALRQVLMRLGHDCPLEQVVSTDLAALAMTPQPSRVQLVVVAFSSDVSRVLGTIRQIRALAAAPLIVIGPRDPNLILEAIHSGADDFIDETKPVDEELATSLQRQFAARGLSAPDGSLIVVASASGGSGRSQIAVNLSIAIARLRSRACLVDLDLTGGVCAPMLNLKPRHTILDLAQHPDRLDRNTLEKSLLVHPSGVSLLPASEDSLVAKRVDGAFFERVVRSARTIFPAVIVDFPQLSDVELLQPLVAHSLTLALVMRLDFNSVRNAGRALAHLERLGIDRQKVQVVANRYGQANEVPLKKVEQALSVRIVHRVPEDPETVNRAINAGTPFAIQAPHTPVAQAIDTLANVLTPCTDRPVAQRSAAENALASEPRSQLQSLLPKFRIGSLLSRLA
jgi:pilus assembly protein CpaE